MNPSSLHCRAFLELPLVSDFLHPLSLCPHSDPPKDIKTPFHKALHKIARVRFFPTIFILHISFLFVLLIMCVPDITFDTEHSRHLSNWHPSILVCRLLCLSFFVFCSKKRPSQRGSKSQDVGRCRRSCYPLLALYTMLPSGWKARFHRNRNRTNRVLKDTISE